MENYQTKPNEPINIVEYNNNYKSTGLTKREYFAAMVMRSIIQNKDGLDIKIERIVESAVDTADALIEELNKNK